MGPRSTSQVDETLGGKMKKRVSSGGGGGKNLAAGDAKGAI